ncbi:hypothetical protein [Pedobacter sp. NJ-S-72]
MIGLYGKKGPSGDLGGSGCTDTEYQSQMSLWSIMAAPLLASNDLRHMNARTKDILLNADVIAINQDGLGKQGARLIRDDVWNVFIKPLQNGDIAVAVLNRSDLVQTSSVSWKELGLNGSYEITDVWQNKTIGKGKKWQGKVQSHETKLFRLKGLKIVKVGRA